VILTPQGTPGLEVALRDTGVRRPAPTDEALVMFTSGTTGTPKGASLTFAALDASVAGIASGSGIGRDGRRPRIPARDPALILVPLAHMGGLLGSLSAWWLGKPVLLAEKFSAALVFDLVRRYRLGVLKLTPAMVWDLVQADHDGRVGRLRDTIICGGFNVYPAQLEAALNSIPTVADSAAVGLPDERLGHMPVAVAVLHPGEYSTGDGIRSAMRSSLAPYELPRRVLVVDKIPRLETGKVDREGVAALFGERT
jgi:acyl-CoA synthetase (AMP-forming)/AMP-acid ligase II